MITRFDRIHERDGRTDRRTDGQTDGRRPPDGIGRASIASCGKKTTVKVIEQLFYFIEVICLRPNITAHSNINVSNSHLLVIS